jgi:hypothetical protein
LGKGRGRLAGFTSAAGQESSQRKLGILDYIGYGTATSSVGYRPIDMMVIAYRG